MCKCKIPIGNVHGALMTRLTIPVVSVARLFKYIFPAIKRVLEILPVK